jgi:hypothetical protein
MNYLLGWVKIPQSFTVEELIKGLSLIEQEYDVEVGIAEFTKIGSVFYRLKLKSKSQSRKVENWRSERVHLVIDNELKLFKGDRK